MVHVHLAKLPFRDAVTVVLSPGKLAKSAAASGSRFAARCVDVIHGNAGCPGIGAQSRFHPVRR